MSKSRYSTFLNMLGSDVIGIQGNSGSSMWAFNWSSGATKQDLWREKKQHRNEKIVIIGDSNQAFLLPLKIALLLGCPVFSGHEDKSNRAYCSSSDWPEVKKIHHFWKEIQNILAGSLSMGQYGDQSSQSFGKTPRRWGHSFDSTGCFF